MFIETYYDERAPVPGNTSEPMIPYPELSGEELEVWQKYLPMRREIENLDSRLNRETIPVPVITEIVALLGGLVARVGGARVTVGAMRVTLWGCFGHGTDRWGRSPLWNNVSEMERWSMKHWILGF